MNIIGTITIKNDLANSHYGFTPTKPLEQYEYKILEKNVDGDHLCVVMDGTEAVGIADVRAMDVDEVHMSPPRLDPVTPFSALLAVLATGNLPWDDE